MPKIKKARICFLSAIFALLFIVTLVTFGQANNVKAASASDSLVYRLDFSDESNFGNNAVENAYADTAVTNLLGENGFKQVSGPKEGSFAIEFPNNDDGGKVEQSYLNLPNTLFKDVTAVTLAGWFFVPSTIKEYSPEIGFFSPTNNKAFRIDPYAPVCSNEILFGYGNNICTAGMGVRPIYDGWRHVAYVMENGKCTVYQNGTQVAVIEDPNMNPALFGSADTVLYLGHSGYEGAKCDYNGKMSDIRVYHSALSRDEIKSEYSLNYKDFKTVEYTFDSAEDLYKENVRGYNAKTMREHSFTNPTSDPAFATENGENFLRLDGTNAFTLIRNSGDKYNLKMLDGHQEMTISMDIRINGSVARDGFERMWDIIVNKGASTGYISACSQRESGVSMDVVVGNLADSMTWTHYANGVNYILNTDEWYNLTWVFGSDSYKVFANGKCILSTNSLNTIRSLYSMISGMESYETFFSLGAPAHEINRLAADYDNVRIWACALNESDVVDAVSSNACMQSKIVNFTVDGKPITLFAGDSYNFSTDCEYGYSLKWYDNGDFTGEPLTSVIPVNGAAYYSQKVKEEWTIEYILPDGATHSNEVSTYSVDSPEIIFSDASLEYHTFDGWYIGETKITSIPTGQNLGGNITLTARFNPIKAYYIAFDANGGTGEMQTIRLAYEENVNIPKNEFKMKGSHFVGWMGSNGVEYADNQSIGQLVEELNGVLTLSAKWESNKYTVRFDLNGGVGEISDINATFGVSATICSVIPEKEGYVFKGWSLTKNGTAEILPESEIINLSYRDGAVVILYARYVRKECVITLNGVSATPTQIKVLYREGVIPSIKLELPENFIGWSTEENGTVVYGKDEYIFVREDIELHAVFEEVTITSANLGKLSNENKENFKINQTTATGAPAQSMTLYIIIAVAVIVFATCCIIYFCRRKTTRP